MFLNLLLKPHKIPIPEELEEKINKVRKKKEKEKLVFSDAKPRKETDNLALSDAKPEKEKKVASLEETMIENDLQVPTFSGGSRLQKISAISDYPNIPKKPKLEKSFNELLFEFIDKRNLKDSEVYKNAYIDRRTFSKIRSSKTYHPSKGTIIQLCLALKLSMEDALTLLKSADYYLTKNTEENAIIYYLFEHEIYNVIDANNLLYSVCNTTIDKL